MKNFKLKPLKYTTANKKGQPLCVVCYLNDINVCLTIRDINPENIVGYKKYIVEFSDAVDNAMDDYGNTLDEVKRIGEKMVLTYIKKQIKLLNKYITK